MKAKTVDAIDNAIWNRLVSSGGFAVVPLSHDPRRLLVKSIAIEISEMEQRVAMALQKAGTRQ